MKELRMWNSIKNFTKCLILPESVFLVFNESVCLALNTSSLIFKNYRVQKSMTLNVILRQKNQIQILKK